MGGRKLHSRDFGRNSPLCFPNQPPLLALIYIRSRVKHTNQDRDTRKADALAIIHYLIPLIYGRQFRANERIVVVMHADYRILTA